MMIQKEDLRFSMFLGISFVLNVMLVFLIPSCSKVINREELKYENIKTDLISIVDTNRKELKTENKTETLNTVEKFSEETTKTEVTEKISATENKNKTDGREKQNTVTSSLSKPKFSGPSRDDKGVEGLVFASTSSKTLREKNEGVINNKTSENNGKDLNYKGNDIKALDLQSQNLKGGTKTFETGKLSKNSVGVDPKNEGPKGKNPEISIKDTGVNNSIPKNISYSTIDVSGGRVVFKKYIAPMYPEEAQANAWNGDVEVEFLIREGKTNFSGITGKSGYSVIDRAVEKAAKNWLLAIEKNGLAVDGKVRVKVEFNF